MKSKSIERKLHEVSYKEVMKKLNFSRQQLLSEKDLYEIKKLKTKLRKLVKEQEVLEERLGITKVQLGGQNGSTEIDQTKQGIL